MILLDHLFFLRNRFFKRLLYLEFNILYLLLSSLCLKNKIILNTILDSNNNVILFDMDQTKNYLGKLFDQ
jgi:hypothetical protein